MAAKGETDTAIINNIKKEPPIEFLSVLPSFDSNKTLGGKAIVVKSEGKVQKPENSKFHCQICSKVFGLRKSLIHHEKSHDNPQCPICLRVLQKKNYEKHLKTHKNEKERKFKCIKCPKMFITYSGLQTHRKIHEDRRRFICDLCGYSTPNKLKLKRHIESHMQRDQYKCTICKRSFKFRHQLLSHAMKSSRDPTICRWTSEADLICDTCGKVLASVSNRLIHEKTHLEKVDCRICKKKFTQISIVSHMELHQLKKIGVRQFKCRQCPMTCWNKKNLRSHMRTHNKFECDRCDFTTVEKFKLEDHFCLHLNPNAFQCGTCGKNLLYRKSLELHMRHNHPKEIVNLFACDVCHRTFNNKRFLYDHKKFHKDKKICPICSKAVSYRRFAFHVMLHKVKQHEPKVECKVCKKKFYTNKHLIDHMSKHKIKFNCDLCGEGFSNKTVMIRHMKSHVNLNCYICGRGFNFKSSLNRHIVTVHRRDP
jgi:KRAB domain-containing zinc finger protein